MEALEKGRSLVESNSRLTVADRERLLGYLEGASVSILPEPQVLLTSAPRVPGLDGRKMSKSYGNTIGLREEPDSVAKKLKTMKTDPARVRRTDPGDPDKMSRCGTCTRSTRTRLRRPGCSRLPVGGHRLPRMQEAADRQGGRPRSRACAERAQAIRGQPGSGAQHRVRGLSRRHAKRRARRSTKCGAPCICGRNDQAISAWPEPDAENRRMPNPPESGRRSSLPPEQVEMPFAMVNGEPMTQLPRDLYIPPQALEVFLEAFEGPLDLLLYLIRRQNLEYPRHSDRRYHTAVHGVHRA